MAKAIKLEHISKAYQLGSFGTGTISRDVERFIAKVRGKEDPFLTVGEVNDRTTKSSSNIVWSLKDINFEIEQGESVGIIGRNGAGKSTLLKILSRITSPTAGTVKIKGRVASLLEVGTGFHPELTGRENIFLNGAVLGMRKKEIKRKFDEIVAFSGVERYIDTPVKRYSSGMYVRLAFAVAAHLESEILIVDEVLAVGDAEFQKKCLGKMGEVSAGEGRTVLFVSHNMRAVQKLCKTGILLTDGINSFTGDIKTSIEKYLDQSNSLATTTFGLAYKGAAEIVEITICNAESSATADISVGTEWKIVIEFVIHKSIDNFVAAIGITDIYGFALKSSWQTAAKFLPGRYRTTFIENKTNFAIGKYYVLASIADGKKNIQYIDNAVSFNIVEGSNLISDQLVSITNVTGVIIDQMDYLTHKI